MKKIITFISAFFVMSTSVFATSNAEVENRDFKKVVFENYVNNAGTREEYYFKNEKLSYIVVEDINLDKKDSRMKKIYHFDENQNLIKYSEIEEKNFENEKLSNDMKKTAETLKENIKTKSNLKEEESNKISTQIQKELDNTYKEITEQMENMRKEIKKEMEDFLKKF